MNPNQPPSSSNSSTLAPSTSRPNAGSQDVRAKAGEAVAKLAEVAQQAGSQAKETASSLASDANKKTKGYLNQQVSAGADLAGHVAESVKSAAESLNQNAPQLAELVRGAADKVEAFSQNMRGQSVDDLVRTASDFTRRQPALVFGLASLTGFFLFRVLKAKPTAGVSHDAKPSEGVSHYGAGQSGTSAGQYHGS